jgi:putative tryptophan/tyrosine transport system substrate-binding protein
MAVMSRRTFIAHGAAFLAVPLAAEAQVAGKTPTIGFVEAGSSSVNRHFADAFRQGLKELGYVEGQSILIEERWAEGKAERFPGLLAELLGLKIDVIVQASGQGAVAAKKATTTVPIVFVGVGDPVGAGLVTSLARPGGNLTGLSLAWAEGLAGKWPELVKETVPSASSAGLLFNPVSPTMASYVRAAQAAASKLGLRLQEFEVRDAKDFDGAFAAMARQKLRALIVITDPLTLRYRTRVVQLAASSRLPAVYTFGEFARVGGLVAYGPSVTEMFHRAAAYVDRILKGAKPADLPVEQPTKFELVINLKAAKALGLTIPPSLLLRADQVLE